MATAMGGIILRPMIHSSRFCLLFLPHLNLAKEYAAKPPTTIEIATEHVEIMMLFRMYQKTDLYSKAVR